MVLREVRYWASVWCYAKCGTWLAYGATRSAVLSEGIRGRRLPLQVARARGPRATGPRRWYKPPTGTSSVLPWLHQYCAPRYQRSSLVTAISDAVLSWPSVLHSALPALSASTNSPIYLPASYDMSGTDLAYGGSCLTDLAYGGISLRACYAMSGTDVAYAATSRSPYRTRISPLRAGLLPAYARPTQCPVLT
eukprot:3435600-Rhodomonas_salina.8